MKRLALNTFIVLSTLACLAALWMLREAVALFLLSLVLSAVARPFYERAVERGIPGRLALAGTYLIGLAVIAALIFLASLRSAADIQRIPGDFRQLFDYIGQNWRHAGWIQQIIARRMPPTNDLLTVLAGQYGIVMLSAALGTALSILGVVIDLLIVVVLSIYWTIDRAHFERLWLSLFSLPLRLAARDISRAIESEVGAYLRSEFTQSLIAGILLALGYRLLGLSYPALLATIAAIAWLVPWVGIVLALSAIGVLTAPSMVFGGPHAIIASIMAAIFTICAFAVLEFVIEPRLFDRRRYNSLLVVLAVIALAETIGVAGLLVGPVLAVAIQVFFEHLIQFRKAPRESAPDHSDLEDRVAALRTMIDSDELLRPRLSNIVERLAALIQSAGDQQPAVEPPSRFP